MRLLVLLSVFVSCVYSAPSFACLDESGNPVTWWAAFKYPDGVKYQYADINSPSLRLSTWAMSDPTNGCLSRTLNQVYSANATYTANDYAFVFYNDEKPDGTGSSSRGHTKGVIGMSQSGGFWLVHSVPQFPNWIKDGFHGYQEPASDVYGQSFLCMTLPFAAFDTIGVQFSYTFPDYYDWNMPSWVPIDLLNSVTKSNHTTQPISHIAPVSSTFTSFAKTSNWNNYLYEFLVAPYWKSDLLVETWMNGVNPDPSFCRNATIDWDVMNIRSLSAFGVSYLETQDHSKWCISTHNSFNVVCIGDINRQQSQNTRAGGTVCFQNTALWTSLNKMITGADTCPSLF